MKYFYLSLFIFIVQQSAFSQKILQDFVNNDVRLISTEAKSIKLIHDFEYSLVKYSSSDTVFQYFLLCESENNKYHHFLNNGIITLNTFNGDTIELTSIYSKMSLLVEYNRMKPYAYYPITISQLQTLFNGVSKIRVEMLSYDKNAEKVVLDYPEIEFKKDKIGKDIKKMFEIVEQQSLKEVMNKYF